MNFTIAMQRKSVLHQAAIVLIASFLAVIPFGQLSQVPMAVMAVLGLILLIKQGKTLWERPEIRLFTQIFAAFWIPIAVSLIGAANPEKTLSVTIVFLRFFPAGVFIIFTLTQPGAMAKLLGLNAWILVIWMVQALLQAGFGLNFPGNTAMGPVNGFFRTGSDLSLVLSVCCPFLLVYSRRTWPLLLQALVFTTIVAVVFMAGGRGGWINLIVVLTGFGAWMMYRDRKNIFRIAVAGL
ncbi:MAG: hypothetical protein LC657_07745, partial [Desulfobacteraceae bacterium]|nr:hypothetical protein [Desulfobacteraceae bacterium]